VILVADYLDLIENIEQRVQECTTVGDAFSLYCSCHAFEEKLEREIELLTQRRKYAKSLNALDARLTHLGALRRRASNAADLTFFPLAHTVSFQGTETQYAICLKKIFSKKPTAQIAHELGIGESTYYRYFADIQTKQLLGKEEFPA
jgi:hypothetical protein